MTPPHHIPAKPVDDIATHEILQGLARLHSLVVVSDLDGKIMWMSDDFGVVCGGARRHVGHHLSEAFAALLEARTPVRLREQISRSLTHLRSHESLNDIRLDLGTRDGVARSVDLSAFRTETQDGRQLVVGIIHPAEQHERGDLLLRGERDALGSILDSSPDAVMALDHHGFITYVNPAVSTLLGLRVDRMLNQPAALFLPRSARLVSLISALRGSGELDNEKLHMEHPDGRSIWLSISARRRGAADGRASGHVVFIREITADVHEKRELERKNAELESYVRSASHDLRSPLVSLLGFTRLLRQDYDHLFNDTGRHFADRIEQAGRTMQALIEDLLEISRIGATNEQRTMVDPRSVLLQLQAELKLRLDEHEATLDIPANPPLVLCDRTRLYQLFSNLVGNALQHMGPCSDRRIRVTVETLEDHHLIAVADSGRGIAPEDLDRIFEVFQSRTKPVSNARSTGVGLAIVRKIAEIHGGRAWAESELGKGARFHVSLPRA